MSQENVDKEAEKKPEKQPRKMGWFMSGCIIIMSVTCILAFIEKFDFLDWGKLDGTIVIVDENGEVIPYRSPTLITLTFFSHYAPSPFRPEIKRKRDMFFDFDDSDDYFGAWIPKFPATLFVQTREDGGKYAAVVYLAESEPTTGLVVTLRPRHVATGRLMDQSGVPLANSEFRLELMRASERVPNGTRAEIATLETLWSRTDADGFFTVTRLIPGVKYNLRAFLPENRSGFADVIMPILEPEQYREPFDLGDVVVR